MAKIKLNLTNKKHKYSKENCPNFRHLIAPNTIIGFIYHLKKNSTKVEF